MAIEYDERVYEHNRAKIAIRPHIVWYGEPVCIAHSKFIRQVQNLGDLSTFHWSDYPPFLFNALRLREWSRI